MEEMRKDRRTDRKNMINQNTIPHIPQVDLLGIEPCAL